ncbi:uncharacterized protein N7515_004053 [Penicillium bovifimosum]|uniref:Uncharacterized protein n=1 Tax=Penicillium bovifimosum TaxID=126998 RepID=A0A9W9H5S7_9EURO|nr:uncharacterized protein N7515_004053 [Penicillium bovifimosum]KAJ5139205.1 hypothetical protein N7515_004053 [Penicillium bovifimosum]
MVPSNTLLALCAMLPMFANAMPAAVRETLESHNVTLTTRDIAEHLARRDGDCPDASGKTSSQVNRDNDGWGSYVDSCGNNGSSGKGECWTDVYVTKAQTQWKPWQENSANLDCANSPTCSITHLESLQECRTWESTTGFSAGITDGVISLGVEATESEGGSECTTSGDNYLCQWEDKKCHKVVASYQVIQVVGYVRRTCKSPNRDDQTERPDGFYTRGWQGWHVDLPTGKWEYSCKYECDTDASQKTDELPEFGPWKKF